MKILPISTYRNQPNNKISAPQYSGNFNTNILHSDMFVKTVPSKKLSFGANLTFAEKFVPFRKDFLKYYRENKVLTFDEIEKIIQKYIPDIEVTDLKELQNQNISLKRTGAYYENEFLITPYLTCHEDLQKIYLSPQKNNEIEEKIELAQGVIHEMTHALQENSKDRLSKVNWLNTISNKYRNINEFINIINIMQKYHTNVEYNINYPLSLYLKKQNEMPLAIADASKNKLNDIYIQTVHAPLNAYIDFIIAKVGDKLGIQNFDKYDKRNIIKYFSHISAKEKEAYANQIDFAKEAMNLKTPVDLDLTRNLYSMFAERCKYWADRVQ